MERPRCKTCPYWEVNDGDGQDGFCRRLPGILAPTESVVNELGMYAAVWPSTHRFDWCGEHPDSPAYIQSLKEEKDARDPRKTVKQRFEPPMGHRP